MEEMLMRTPACGFTTVLWRTAIARIQFVGPRVMDRDSLRVGMRGRRSTLLLAGELLAFAEPSIRVADFRDSTIKAGYFVEPQEQLALSVDLMNMLHDQAQDDIVFKITYEYIEGQHAKDFSAVTPYWFDVGGCGPSDVPAYRDAMFNYSSPTLKGAPQGTTIFVGGHLHDGGTHVDLVKNDKAICSVNAAYENYQHLGDKGSTAHISSIQTCEMVDTTTPEDEWSIKAYYDTSIHEPMALMDGSLEPVMGIMLVYVMPGPEQHWTSRKWPLNFVLGLGCLTGVVLLLAAWLWIREDRGIRLTQWASGPKLWNRDREFDGDSAVPLMKA